jgi:hypothetical protein
VLRLRKLHGILDLHENRLRKSCLPGHGQLRPEQFGDRPLRKEAAKLTQTSSTTASASITRGDGTRLWISEPRRTRGASYASLAACPHNRQQARGQPTVIWRAYNPPHY